MKENIKLLEVNERSF